MKIPVVIHAVWDEYTKTFSFRAWPTDMTSCGYIPCVNTEIEFDEPNHADLISGTIKVFKAEQEKIRAEATGKVTALQERIDDMLFIEHKVEAAA